MDCSEAFLEEFEHLQEFEQHYHPVAGVDEVGRGALFGAVVAAAVVLPVNAFELLKQSGVTDSKRLSAQRRTDLDMLIRELAVGCQVGMATVVEIENLNILGASLLAMERAIAQLATQPHPCQPNHCLIDGNQPLRFQLIAPIPQTTIVKGDAKSMSIAAASIVAKVWRDRLITELDAQYPGYDLIQSKGYPTAKHLAGIRDLGWTDQHRRSFKVKQLSDLN